MMKYIIGIISLAILILIILKLNHCKSSSEKYDTSETVMDTSDLPPSNYFSLQEPSFFFYDPQVSGDDGVAFEQGMRKHPRDSNYIYNLDRATEIGDVFGKDNYIRRYDSKI